MQGLHHECLQSDRGPGHHSHHRRHGLWCWSGTNAKYPHFMLRFIETNRPSSCLQFVLSKVARQQRYNGIAKLLSDSVPTVMQMIGLLWHLSMHHPFRAMVPPWLHLPLHDWTWLLVVQVVDGNWGVHCIVPKWMFNMSDMTPYSPLVMPGTSKPANMTLQTTL